MKFEEIEILMQFVVAKIVPGRRFGLLLTDCMLNRNNKR